MLEQCQIGFRGYNRCGSKPRITSTIMTSLPKRHIVASCFLRFISSGVASAQTNVSTIIIIFCSSMKSRVGLSVAFRPSPHKNGGLFWEALIGSHSGPNPTRITLQHSIPTFSGSTEALSFSAMIEAQMLLRVVITLPLDCLVVATSVWTRRTTPISTKSSYTTSIPSMSLRKSRRWNASFSKLISRSDGEISVLKSRRLWRCGIHRVAASISNSSAIRRCGGDGFGHCAKLWPIGMALSSGIGVSSQMQKRSESTGFQGQIVRGSPFGFSHSSFTRSLSV